MGIWKRNSFTGTLVLFLAFLSLPVLSQESIEFRDVNLVLDSLKTTGIILHETPSGPEIKMSREQAVSFLRQTAKNPNWKNPSDPFRNAIERLLVEAENERFDSIAGFLAKYPYDSISVPWERFFVWKPLNVKVPVVTRPLKHADLLAQSDSALLAVNDSLSFEALSNFKDTTIMFLSDTLRSVAGDSPSSPFSYLTHPYQSDSLKVAVNEVLDYLASRDSSIVYFRGPGNAIVPVWMTPKPDGTMKRFWLKNEFADSVTVWIGSEGKNLFGLYLEQGINFRKPMRQENFAEAKINVQTIDKSKLEKQNIILKKKYWDYRTESSVVLSQSALSNWVKGGENSISTALDVTAYADYKRPELKLSSSNFARLKLGFLKSGSEDIRKNLDLLETNSKVNHKAFGKFDFSAILLFKTQIAIGKAYTKDTSYMVSRFFNPATVTLGFGLDYKPDKETSINFSPLSYKGTFVPAGGKITADSLVAGKIDQTTYGVALGRRSKHEPGASLQVSRVSHPFENLTITNRLQLFTNYVNNPQNIDVDWEMIAVMNLNWFTELRLNTHLIYDDDTKTTLMKGGAPVLLEDGTEKKTARTQFKEMFGISLVFRF
jgi:hypothetical protein